MFHKYCTKSKILKTRLAELSASSAANTAILFSHETNILRSMFCFVFLDFRTNIFVLHNNFYFFLIYCTFVSLKLVYQLYQPFLSVLLFSKINKSPLFFYTDFKSVHTYFENLIIIKHKCSSNDSLYITTYNYTLTTKKIETDLN